MSLGEVQEKHTHMWNVQVSIYEVYEERIKRDFLNFNLLMGKPNNREIQ